MDLSSIICKKKKKKHVRRTSSESVCIILRRIYFTARITRLDCLQLITDERKKHGPTAKHLSRQFTNDVHFNETNADKLHANSS